MRSRFVMLVTLLAMSACSDQDYDMSGYPEYVISGVVDLRTGYSSDSGAPTSSYGFWVDTTDLPPGHVTSETLQLVRWPAGDLVPGVWEPSREEELAGRATVRFIPEGTLDEGWYALRLFLPAPNYYIGETRLRSEGSAVVRARVGSLPTCRLYGLPSEGVTLAVSEPLILQSEADLLSFVEYRVDGRLASCTTVGRDAWILPAGATFESMPLECEVPPPGAVAELRFVAGGAFGGTALVDREGQSPPSWTFGADAPPTNEPTDAYFELGNLEVAP